MDESHALTGLLSVLGTLGAVAAAWARRAQLEAQHEHSTLAAVLDSLRHARTDLEAARVEHREARALYEESRREHQSCRDELSEERRARSETEERCRHQIAGLAAEIDELRSSIGQTGRRSSQIDTPPGRVKR